MNDPVYLDYNGGARGGKRHRALAAPALRQPFLIA